MGRRGREWEMERRRWKNERGEREGGRTRGRNEGGKREEKG